MNWCFPAGKAAVREHRQVELKPVVLLRRTAGPPGGKEAAFEVRSGCLRASVSSGEQAVLRAGERGTSCVIPLICRFCYVGVVICSLGLKRPKTF